MFGLFALGLLGASVARAAPTDTDYFLIGRLEASADTNGGYRVYPTSYTLPTICARNDFAQAEPSQGPVVGPRSYERDLMNRLLMGAFQSSRMVRLRLDGCHANDRPLYRIVTVDFQR